MLGGFNKILRNIVAGASDTEFEKVRHLKISSFILFNHLDAYLSFDRDWQKQPFTWTVKSQKKSMSYVSTLSLIFDVVLLECMNGEHKDIVSPLGSLKFILERHISNLDNWAINIKVLIIFHRALQNIKVNRKIYKDLKSKEHLLHPYQNK